MVKGSSIQRSNTALYPFELNGLYILLSNRNLPDKWHWALYFHCGRNGWIFYITRVADRWFLDHYISTNIIHLVGIVAALKIAIIEDTPGIREALIERIPGIPLEDTARFGRLTCRTWLLRAVAELDNEGHIRLKPGTTLEDIQTEATSKALRAAINNSQTIDKSSFSIA